MLPPSCESSLRPPLCACADTRVLGSLVGRLLQHSLPPLLFTCVKIRAHCTIFNENSSRTSKIQKISPVRRLCSSLTCKPWLVRVCESILHPRKVYPESLPVRLWMVCGYQQEYVALSLYSLAEMRRLSLLSELSDRGLYKRLDCSSRPRQLSRPVRFQTRTMAGSEQ